MSEEQAVYRGWKIREARLRAAIGTQKELALRTGLAPNIISDLERGRRNVSPAWAMRIAEAVGVKPDDLLKG
ncbi:MAG: helix-turn-helix domain-containing protein [Desulfitobacteriaceae bacterium]